MKDILFVTCVAILTLVAFAPPASGCSCAAEWMIENDLAEPQSIIFSGKITNIIEQQRTFLVTFDVNQSWKGMPSNVTKINVMTAQHDASCGYSFQPNESYLVVAYGKWDQTPDVSSCSSTVLLDFAGGEISFLNKNSQSQYHYSKPTLENEILILLENNVRKVYYTGKNIISVFVYPETASVTFETGANAKLEIKAPQVYKIGPGLFTLRNSEEVDPVKNTDECFYYASIETTEPEKIEIIFAAWPEYKELVENCETFTVSPLKQIKLGRSISDIVCKEELQLITKHDGLPACVKPSTATKLIERGWTKSNTEGPSSRHCSLVPETGPCKAAFTKYYYDSDSKSCKAFTWGGCGGTVPFDSLDLCKSLCQ